VELRAGVSLPSGDMSDDVDAGLAVSGDVIYQVTPMVGAYAGYNLNHYGFKDTNDADAEVKGFEGGVRVTFPSPNFTPFFRGGALYQKSSVSGSGVTLSSDYELGFNLGGGVEVPITSRFSFTPQASFSKVKDAEYINVEAGLRIKL
jgi:opacity protein-like surface antigen